MDTLSNPGNIDSRYNLGANGLMERFYRAISLPALALLIAAAAPDAVNKAGDRRGAATASVAKSQPVAVPPLVRTQSVDPVDGGCEVGKDDRSSDLCAQWKAADAADRGANAADQGVVWARWQFWAGLVGAGFSFVALGAAIAAAIFAGMAHRLTLRVTNAYLGVRSHRSEYMIEDGVKELRFMTAYVNYGPTPARDVEVWEFGPCFVKDTPTKPIVALGSEPYHTFDTVVPAGDARETHGVAITPEQFVAMANGELRLFLPFHIRYKTIFSNKVHTVLSETEVRVFTVVGAEDKPLVRYLQHRYETT